MAPTSTWRGNTSPTERPVKDDVPRSGQQTKPGEAATSAAGSRATRTIPEAAAQEQSVSQNLGGDESRSQEALGRKHKPDETVNCRHPGSAPSSCVPAECPSQCCRSPPPDTNGSNPALEYVILPVLNPKLLSGILPQSTPFPSCEHYDRGCYLQCATCEKYYQCRRCHDENEANCKFKRRETKLVACSTCGAKDQPAVENCGACGVRFAKYFCDVCVFYDDCTDGEEVYHCEDCGICRVGKKEDNYHCTRCNSCVPIGVKESHPCMQNALERDCPICLEDLQTSISQVVYMKCGHAMHSSCFDLYTKRSYTCPLCHKALTDMSTWYKALEARIAAEEMPIEYARKRNMVSCYDCDKKSITPFHFQFHQCSCCGGYNTFVEGSAPNASDEEVQNECRRRAGIAENAAAEVRNYSNDQRKCP